MPRPYRKTFRRPSGGAARLGGGGCPDACHAVRRAVRFLGQCPRAVRCPVSGCPVQPSGVQPSGHLVVPSSGTDLSGRLVPSVRRPAVWCPPVRPVASVPSRVSPPWPWEHASPAGPSRLEWVGSRVACRVASGSSTAEEAWTPGDAAEVVGRPVGEGAGRESGPVAFGLRRRPRSAADRPGRPACPEGGSPLAADLGQDAQLLSVVVVEPAAPGRRARKGQRARRQGWERSPSAAQRGNELARLGADNALTCENSGGRDRV
jgi:hypothetical protein